MPKTIPPAREFDILEGKTKFRLTFYICKCRPHHWINWLSSMYLTHLMQTSLQMTEKSKVTSQWQSQKLGYLQGFLTEGSFEPLNPLQASCLFCCFSSDSALLINSNLLLFSSSVISNSFVTPWTVAHQAPLSMGSPRHELYNGLPFLSPEIILNQGLNHYLLFGRWILYHWATSENQF